MFVPKIPLVAVFGDGKPNTWHEKAVIAIDDNGDPWVVATDGKRGLVRASHFSNYQELRVVGGDARYAFDEIVPAHAGWRAAYACECFGEDNSRSVEINILPVAAWKRVDGSLIPLVPACVSHGISEGSVWGRSIVDDPQTFASEKLLAIFGPGEELPDNAKFVEMAMEDLKAEEAFNSVKTPRLPQPAPS